MSEEIQRRGTFCEGVTTSNAVRARRLGPTRGFCAFHFVGSERSTDTIDVAQEKSLMKFAQRQSSRSRKLMRET